MRALTLLFAFAVVGLTNGLSPQPAVARADAEAPATENLTISFTGFDHRQVQLFINGDLVVDRIMETPDWSTEFSWVHNASVHGPTTFRLVIDGIDHTRTLTIGSDRQVLYITPRDPVFALRNHEAPLLD
ncbi:MAG: hypothetical protein HY859_01785 [Caulobacterales bacterium]|nr:hypothetical protein [Caulobacterales bacterium]